MSSQHAQSQSLFLPQTSTSSTFTGPSKWHHYPSSFAGEESGSYPSCCSFHFCLHPIHYPNLFVVLLKHFIYPTNYFCSHGHCPKSGFHHLSTVPFLYPTKWSPTSNFCFSIFVSLTCCQSDLLQNKAYSSPYLLALNQRSANFFLYSTRR